MTCRIDHSLPETIPQALCRGCHPELIPTPDKLAAAEKAERVRRQAEQAELTRKRELDKALRKIASITRRGEPDEGTVNAKIVASLRKKINRLTPTQPA